VALANSQGVEEFRGLAVYVPSKGISRSARQPRINRYRSGNFELKRQFVSARFDMGQFQQGKE